MENYQTSDYLLAASLVCLGVGLDMCNDVGEGRMAFVFKRFENLDLVLQQYWSGKLLVEPRLFAHAQKYLKGLIRTAQRPQ